MTGYKVTLVAAIASLIVIPIAFVSSGVTAGIIAVFITLALAFIADRLKRKMPPPVKEDRVEKLLNRVKEKELRFDEELSDIPQVTIKPSNKANCQLLLDMPEARFYRLPEDIDRIFPLVVLDVETTGLDCVKDEIIEVSAIKYEDGFAPASCFTTLCRPLKGINKNASAVNGITEDMVYDKPCFQEVADQLSDYLSGCNVAGYNVLFDVKFLFVGGVTFDRYEFFDVYRIAKNTVPEDAVMDYKLDTICEYYGIFHSDSHRSLSDAFATAKLLEELAQ